MNQGTAAKTAFVLAGGGSLGAVPGRHAAKPYGCRGATRLYRRFVGRRDERLYFAGQPDAGGVERLAQIWLGLRRQDIFPFTLSAALGLLRHADYLVDPSSLRGLIERHLSYVALQEARLPVYIVATDMPRASL